MFEVKNEDISVVLVFLLLTLNIFFTPYSNVSIFNFEHVIAG